MAEFIYQMYKARKAHGDKVILDDVTLSFYPGAKIGVVGPNGMGKSTLLKIMAGIEEVSNGDARLTPGYSVGILQQEPPLDEDKTVLENIEMAFADVKANIARFNEIGTLMGEPDADFDALMEEMGKLQDAIDAANGWDHSPVRPAGETPPPKSVGNGLTFRRNLTGAEEIQAGAQLLAERVALRLRRHQLKCTTVQVSLRSPEFKTIQRQKGTPAPTNVSRVIFQCVVELLEGTWNWSAPLRAMTITAAGLVPEEEAGEQLDLFTPQAAVRRGKA